MIFEWDYWSNFIINLFLLLTGQTLIANRDAMEIAVSEELKQRQANNHLYVVAGWEMS